MEQNLKTCQYCRWFMRVKGKHYLPWPQQEDELPQENVEVCCYNPPTSGLFPWSFGEVDVSARCSKWEPKQPTE